MRRRFTIFELEKFKQSMLIIFTKTTGFPVPEFITQCTHNDNELCGRQGFYIVAPACGVGLLPRLKMSLILPFYTYIFLQKNLFQGTCT